MHQGRHKSRVGLLRRETVDESVGQHGRWERLLDVDPPPLSPETSSLLNGAGPGVEVEGPQGVVVGAVRGGGGGVTTGATTSAASSVVVASSLSMLRLSRVVVIGH
jgi:hypothetical protein